ncbi:MAG: hypothetical protein R3E42_04685 [Burkholderiaceae bacterium]
MRELHRTTIKVQGFMTPWSQVPNTPISSCSPCRPLVRFAPGGAESMVEVRTRRAVKFTQNALVLQGRFEVLEQDPQGLYYRMTDARVVK